MVAVSSTIFVDFEPTTVVSFTYTPAGDTVVCAAGPLGSLRLVFKSSVNFRVVAPGRIALSYASRAGRRLCRGYSRILNRALDGLGCKFSELIELRGLGYKLRLLGNTAELTLGFSHAVFYTPPAGVSMQVLGNKSRVLQLQSSNWGLLRGAVAALRQIRPPGAYKERGIYVKYEVGSYKSGKKKKFG